MPDGSQHFILDETDLAQRLAPPEAPLAMPPQVLERRYRRRWLGLLSLGAL
ncbi:hypothetical protein [Rubellimicrobium roseum]|uniref:hypothetical protein n=1 Tax=Rubellimicrobium roseum TaxID=687525 RepID=UPI00159BEDB1|nr:hypothetical protein [Rubellimicrobium roseum]